MSKSYLTAPIYRSILTPPTIFGMPRNFFVLIGITTMVLVFSLGQIWFLAVTLVLMIVSRKVSKDNPFAFDIYAQSFKLPKELD